MKRKGIFARTEPVSSTDTLLFRFVCIFLSLALLFCGCAPITADPATTPTSSATETDPDTPSQDPLVILKQWLEKDCSFTLSSLYMNLAINGLSQETTQVFAADGCWSFQNQRKIWDHTANYESEENAEFYYRYEDSQLICYSIINGNVQQRAVLNKADQKAMNDSKAYMIGVPGLLPDYLQDLSVTQTDDAAVFTYTLPVERILADSTLLAAYTQSVFALSNYEYKPEDQLLIGCTFETDPETFQPKSLSFDFSQLKPYVLTNGAQSGEFALDADFMTMVYTFDYNLPSTIAIPENLIP